MKIVNLEQDRDGVYKPVDVEEVKSMDNTDKFSTFLDNVERGVKIVDKIIKIIGVKQKV